MHLDVGGAVEKETEVIGFSGLTAATQIGADYPFDDAEARRSFNYYGSILYGWGFRKASG